MKAIDAQVRYIRALNDEVDGEELLQEALDEAGEQQIEDLSKAQASALIDELKALTR